MFDAQIQTSKNYAVKDIITCDCVGVFAMLLFEFQIFALQIA